MKKVIKGKSYSLATLQPMYVMPFFFKKKVDLISSSSTLCAHTLTHTKQTQNAQNKPRSQNQYLFLNYPLWC